MRKKLSELFGKKKGAGEVSKPGGNASSSHSISLDPTTSPGGSKIQVIDNDKDPTPTVISLEDRLLQNPYGLTVLHDPSDPTIDIIFVHGLTGHPYKTWLDKKSRTYWPIDLLSKDLPTARILTFGYDADITKILGPISQNTLRDHANELLREIAHRKTRSPERKIIFITHSLGGLITKKALFLSTQASKSPMGLDLVQVHRSTLAVLFLGTPHRGSELASPAALAAKLLNASGKRVNDKIFSSLDRNSEILAEVEDFFTTWLRKYGKRVHIVCFYEELELRTLGFVVPKESAVIPGHPFRGIHANHMDLARFDRSERNGYHQILDELKIILEPPRRLAEQAIVLSNDVKDCLQSLAFPEMDNRHHEIDRVAGGTCAWLLSHEKYCNWITRRHNLLWIGGNPGSGKSTLLKYAVQDFSRNDRCATQEKSLVLSFFFHGRGFELQKTPLGLFRCLLHQLLSQMPDQFSDLVHVYKKKCDTMGPAGDKWNWTASELRDIFTSSLLQVTQNTALWIFVDALDECGKDTAYELAALFRDCVQACNRDDRRFSICFTCRHYPLMALPKAEKINVEDENHHDIATFVQIRLAEDIEDGPEREGIANAIIERASGVFQWARLVVDRVKRFHREGRGTQRIMDEIKNIPSDLEEMYRGLFQSIDEVDRPSSLKLMRWVCFAIRPLMVKEIRYAMILDADPRQTSLRELKVKEDFIETDEKMEKRIRTLSRGLAEVQQSLDGRRIVQSIHQSVTDFFLRDGMHLLGEIAESNEPSLGRSHYYLSRSCLCYIRSDEVCQHLRGLFTELIDDKGSLHAHFRFDKKQYPFLLYAWEHWLKHTQISEADGISQVDVLKYLDSPPYPFENVQLICSKFTVIYADHVPKLTSLHLSAENNLMSVVSDVLRQNTTLADSKDSFGRTPLSLAAGKGHEKIVRLLINREDVKADSKDERGRTPLSHAASSGYESVVRLLVSREDVKADSKDNNGRTPLSYAASSGFESVVRLLLSREDVKADSKDNNGRTPLLYAAWSGYESVVRLLVSREDVKADSKDECGRTPLSHAAWFGHESVVRLLLSREDVKADSKDERGRTPLLYAAWFGRESVVRLLVSREDVKADSKDNDGRNPLSYAASFGHESVVRLLVSREYVEADSRDDNGRIPLSYATEYGHEKVVRLLLDKNGVVANSKDCNGRTPL